MPSNSPRDGPISNRVQRIERLLQSQPSEFHVELPSNLLAALNHVESILENPVAPVRNTPKEPSISGSSHPTTQPETSASPQGATTSGSHLSPASGRPILFSEASYKRWGAQSAVGVACTGVETLMTE
jgi:hypothetical protein